MGPLHQPENVALRASPVRGLFLYRKGDKIGQSDGWHPIPYWMHDSLKAASTLFHEAKIKAQNTNPELHPSRSDDASKWYI